MEDQRRRPPRVLAPEVGGVAVEASRLRDPQLDGVGHSLRRVWSALVGDLPLVAGRFVSLPTGMRECLDQRRLLQEPLQEVADLVSSGMAARHGRDFIANSIRLGAQAYDAVPIGASLRWSAPVGPSFDIELMADGSWLNQANGEISDEEWVREQFINRNLRIITA